jgi:methylated-DNA-[protein]-cysteine S-methyltransferase
MPDTRGTIDPATTHEGWEMSRTSSIHPSTLRVRSPVGPLTVVYAADGVRSVQFGGPEDGHPGDAGAEDGLGRRVEAELREYFAGERRSFTVPLAPGGTDFQRRVWDALAAIPYGETRSYAEIAAQLGVPGAARAVGQANRSNPVPILVPCHRVIAADGRLGGYLGAKDATAGLETKRWLLRLESAAVRPA